MTWLIKQEQKTEHIWEISPMVCKVAFLPAKHQGQPGTVFCSLQRQLPVELLWTFYWHHLAYVEAFITLLVHLSQAHSSSQRAILLICEHLLEVLEWILTQHNEDSANSGVADSPLLSFGSMAGKKEKRNFLDELSQHCNNAQIKFMIPQGITKLQQL